MRTTIRESELLQWFLLRAISLGTQQTLNGKDRTLGSRRRTVPKIALGCVVLGAIACGALLVSSGRDDRRRTSVLTADTTSASVLPGGIVVTPRDGYCLTPNNDCTDAERELAKSPQDIVLTRPQPGKGSLSRDDAVQLVTKATSIVRRADRVQTKLTTWERYVSERQLMGINDDVGGIAPPALTGVWLVAVEGNVHPQRARVEAGYSWAIFVIDQATGSHLSTVANDGPLPSYFAAIPDSKTA